MLAEAGFAFLASFLAQRRGSDRATVTVTVTVTVTDYAARRVGLRSTRYPRSA